MLPYVLYQIHQFLPSVLVGGGSSPLPVSITTSTPGGVNPGGGCVLRPCFDSFGRIPPPPLPLMAPCPISGRGQHGLVVDVPGRGEPHIYRACRSTRRPPLGLPFADSAAATSCVDTTVSRRSNPPLGPGDDPAASTCMCLFPSRPLATNRRSP